MISGIVIADEPRHHGDAMISRLEQLCLDKGLKMTEQRRVIARVLSDSADHPDVEQVYRRATEIDLQSGRVIEFRNDEIEKLQHYVAEQLGYDLVGHRLELYAVPRKRKE